MPESIDARLFSAVLERDWDRLVGWLDSGTITTDAFLGFADTHQLGGFLHLRFADLDRAPAIDSVLLRHLERSYEEQKARCLETLREATRILQAFRAKGQRQLFLKGPFSAARYYGDVHARSHWDVDVMIRKRDFRASDRLLKDLGFARRSIAFLGIRPMSRFAHTFEYRKRVATEIGPGQRYHLPLDLHWSLQTHFSFHIDDDEIWRQATECTIEGRSYPVLGDEHALLTTLLSIFADAQLGVLSLKALLDLDQVVQTLEPQTDWNRFLQRRRPEGTLRICLGMFQLFFQLLERPDRYPALRQAVEAHDDELPTLDADQLLERSRFALKNRRWALALYQAPRPLSVAWSLLLIPFRVLAYESRDPAPIRWLRDLREDRFNAGWQASAHIASKL